MGRGDGPGAHTSVRKIARFWALSILWAATQACTTDSGPSTCLNPQPLPPYCSNGNTPGFPSNTGADAAAGNPGASSGSSGGSFSEDASVGNSGSGTTPPPVGIADAASPGEGGSVAEGVSDASADTNPGVGGDAASHLEDASLDAPAGDAAPADAALGGASSDAGHD